MPKNIRARRISFCDPFDRFCAGGIIGSLDDCFFKFLYNLKSLGKKVAVFKGTTYVVEQENTRLVKSWPTASTMANPAWWMLWSLSFLWRWVVSRPYGPMLLALPGIVALAGLSAITMRGASIPRGVQVAQYRQKLSTSARNNDMERTRLLSDALLRLTPNSGVSSYVRALVEAENGDVEKAAKMMEDIARSEDSAQAALWLSNHVRVPDTEFEDWPQENKRDYFDWLMLAIQNEPSNPVPRRLLGDVFRAIGDLEQAYEIMKPIAETSNENACLVAYLENELGMTEIAKARADQLEKNYRQLLYTNPGDISARTQHAMLLLLLEREQEAVDTLTDGLDWTQDSQQRVVLNRAIAEAMVVQANKLRAADQTPSGMMQSLEKLRAAMEVDPTNPSLLESIIEVCLKAADSPEKDLVILREAVVQGVSSDASHFILGTTCLMEGNVEEGNRHLEVALTNNPNLPGLLNNLAYSISMQENPDLERALRLSNKAIEALPGNAYVRETRGHIYLKMERYSEAIADLEVALEVPELRPLVRPKLITAYESVGDSGLAERHRQLLERGR